MDRGWWVELPGAAQHRCVDLSARRRRRLQELHNDLTALHGLLTRGVRVLQDRDLDTHRVDRVIHRIVDAQRLQGSGESGGMV